MQTQFQICRKCNEEKILTDFAPAKLNRSGREYICRICRRIPKIQANHEIRCGVTGKICTICKFWKSLEDFCKNKSISDGKDYRCKECANAKSKAAHAADPVAWNERNKAGYHKHKETRLPAVKAYRDANIDRVRAHNRARNKRRYLENPAERKVYSHRRRARMKNLNKNFTAQEWRDLCTQYNHTCLCCGKQEPEIKLSVDHVVPIARGGSNEITNIQPLCLTCNLQKSTKTIDYRY